MDDRRIASRGESSNNKLRGDTPNEATKIQCAICHRRFSSTAPESSNDSVSLFNKQQKEQQQIVELHSSILKKHFKQIQKTNIELDKPRIDRDSIQKRKSLFVKMSDKMSDIKEGRGLCCRSSHNDHYSCFDCFEFFHRIVSEHRDSRIRPQISCKNRVGFCCIVPVNETRDSIVSNCLQCWLDKCVLAGMKAESVAFIGIRRVGKKEKERVEKLDQYLRDRLLALHERMDTIQMSGPVSEHVMEIGLLKSMAYVDQQFSMLRLACSAKGRISRVFRMFEHCTLSDLTGTAPILFGSARNQKMLLLLDKGFPPQSDESSSSCDSFDCVYPNFSDDEKPQFKSGEYVTVWLEHSDPFLALTFCSQLDVFMCFEMAHTMPVFRLLDATDMKLQLSSTAMHCRALIQASFSVSLDAPELVFPGGIMPHRTLMAVLRKAWDLILKKEHFDFEQEDANGTRNNAEVGMVPVRVLAAPQLLVEFEQYSREHRVDLLKPFFDAKPTTTEVLLLRALIMTSPNTPGLSESARLLLGIEWNKYSKLLRNHLRAELGSPETAEKRHTQLMRLLNTVAEMRALNHRWGQLSYKIFQVPSHCHQSNSTSSDTIPKCRRFPAFMKECRYAYDADDIIINMTRFVLKKY